MERVPMTPNGYEKMKKELENLLRVERPSVIKMISEAREFGDLSENAEYDSAKNRQSFIEGRIQELESKVSRAEVIDPAKLTNKD
ncbi:MAG: transcription elongation factor GreA, partial [Deltaproteobacteria bacterium]